MPTALSLDSFVDLVQRSRLVSADQMQEVLHELQEAGVEPDSPQALAEALIDRELLTRWQVGYLLKGKHNGFFLGSYRFLKMLGKGGMGAVYLAEHEMMRRRCAIKVLPTKLISESSSVLERFYLEAQAVAALDDPNIVRAYDVNKEVQGKREIHYLVMEYVDGCDLQVHVEKVGPLDYVSVADFARQAASGLEHAHESSLIHRDIKPANLLIDEKGTVKILDLGLARFFDDRLDASLTTTHNESILGTADYLSPEQALDSHNVDTRTDIYSLGCTCYFMLTGQPPFPEGSVAQRLLSHQVKSPTAVEKLRPDVPVDLVTIVERMIAKSPDDRYQSAGEVADAFGAWLAKHADDDWKKTHRGVLESSEPRARREPTRAKSAATEDTDLELGLAPTEDTQSAPVSAPTKVSTPAAVTSAGGATELGLDQLEELESAAPAPDMSGSSSGIDDLLSEALENYPAFDSGVSLAGAAVGSGIQPASAAPVGDKTEQIQLVKLILIGFAVSVPLAGVILFASFWSSTPAVQRTDLPNSSLQTAQAPQPPAVSEEPQPTSPKPATTSDSAPDGSESSPSSESTTTVQPTTPADDEPTPAPPMPQERPPENTDPAPAISPDTPSPPSTTIPAAPPSENKTPTTPPPSAAPAARPTASSSPKPIPAGSEDPPAATPTKGDPNRDSESQNTQLASQELSPEKVKKLLADLSTVTIKFDREHKGSYDLMVLKTATEAIENAGLKARPGSPAVLTLTFAYEKAEPYVVFTVGAVLTCRDENASEVPLWKDSKEVARLRPNVLGKTPPKVLRDKVASFYSPLIREYRLAGRKR